MVQPLAPAYQQQFLLPPCLEDWVPADHPVRFLREFVDMRDLSALGFRMPANTEGRPAYAPSLLLKIWLYGYFHRIRSSRQLEAACREHCSLMWLTAMIAPDHNSLWRFWRENKKALRSLFKETVGLAIKAGAVGLALQALDGTKIEAASSGYSGWSKKYMQKLLAQLDSALEQIETQVDQAHDPASPAQGYRLPESLAERQALRQEIEKGLAQLEADGRQHYHPLEPEARRMKLANGTNRYGYNAQAVADANKGVIVACEVSRQEHDKGLLVEMVQKSMQSVAAAPEAKSPAAVGPVTLADSGYGAGAEIQAAAEKGLRVLVPPAQGTPARGKAYAAENFRYDAQSESVTCPQGRGLDHEGQTIKDGVVVQRYRCHCRDCPVRAECTEDAKGRQIEVRPHAAAVQSMRQQLKAAEGADLYKRRGEIIERRFAQLKWHDRFRRWTVRGLEAVSTQWSLLCTTLNLRVLFEYWRSGPKAALA